MSSKLKKRLFIVLVIIIGFAIAIPIANSYVKKKIVTGLENLPSHIKAKVDDISVNVVSGSVAFNTIELSVLGKTTNETNLEIKLKDVLVKKIGYLGILFNDEIVIKNIELNQPQITYYHNDAIEKKDIVKKDSIAKSQLINIESFNINEGAIHMISRSNESLLLKTEKFNLSLNDVTNRFSKKYKTPISFNDFEFLSESIFLNVGKYENLKLGSIHANNHSVSLKSIEFKTKYSRFELSQLIPSERDHINLEIDSLVMDNMDFGFKKDSVFNFEAKSIAIYKPKFINFRDKLVADNFKQKSLYSKMLRDLKVDLTLNHVEIFDGEVVYEEKVNHNIIPGKIFFTEYNASIENVSNTYKSGKAITKIITHTKFMGDALLKTEWEFDVNDLNDHFIYKAELGSFNINNINQFMEPNLNIDIQGTLHKTFFTISGNAISSSIDFKTNFDDFKISVLRKNEHKKNKVLSSIANMVVPKSSSKGKDHYVEGRRDGIVRDKTKSVFNFIWLNVKAGLIHAKR